MSESDSTLQRKYKVLKPFLHNNVKVTKFVELNPRQAVNLLAGGSIAEITGTAVKTTK